MHRGDCVTPGAICCSMHEIHFAVKNLEGNWLLSFSFELVVAESKIGTQLFLLELVAGCTFLEFSVLLGQLALC